MEIARILVSTRSLQNRLGNDLFSISLDIVLFKKLTRNFVKNVDKIFSNKELIKIENIIKQGL